MEYTGLTPQMARLNVRRIPDLPPFKFVYTPRKFPPSYVLSYQPNEIFPTKTIRGLKEDIFWALVQRFVTFDEDPYPQVRQLLILRGILSPGFVGDFNHVLTGYPQFPTIGEAIYNPMKFKYDSAYLAATVAITYTAIDVHENSIDPYLPYVLQFQYRYGRLLVEPTRLSTPFDEEPQLYYTRMIVIYLLSRYLFFSNYSETPAFLRYMASPFLLETFTTVSDRKVLFSMLKQACPDCEMSVPMMADLPSQLPEDIRYIISNMTRDLRQFNLSEDARKEMREINNSI